MSDLLGMSKSTLQQAAHLMSGRFRLRNRGGSPLLRLLIDPSGAVKRSSHNEEFSRELVQAVQRTGLKDLR